MTVWNAVVMAVMHGRVLWSVAVHGRREKGAPPTLDVSLKASQLLHVSLPLHVGHGARDVVAEVPVCAGVQTVDAGNVRRRHSLALPDMCTGHNRKDNWLSSAFGKPNHRVVHDAAVVVGKTCVANIAQAPPASEEISDIGHPDGRLVNVDVIVSVKPLVLVSDAESVK
ncbi:hypothetical protein E2C01_032996 [Portunus trituberculatus]|uniref:Uncharacterized protein n=1 Tax=Portunus trituberculatus TaxID=210409 RepID=A0A5B7F2K6_PORTR|nr:hypothetical protein [Portunus trituberculatus]